MHPKGAFSGLALTLASEQRGSQFSSTASACTCSPAALGGGEALIFQLEDTL